MNVEKTVKKANILNIKFIGIDSWNRPVYKDKNGTIYKDINLGKGVLALHTSVNNEFYGEPYYPIRDNIKINIVQRLENEPKRDSMSEINSKEKALLIKYDLYGEEEFRYMILNRLQLDCKYFLGNGNRNNKYLWASDPKEHIKIMKALYKSLTTPPKWITMEEIKYYEKNLTKENCIKKKKNDIERNER